MLRAIFFGHSAVSSSSQSMSFGQWTYSTSSLPIRSEKMSGHLASRPTIAQGRIHSERPLQKRLYGLPDWAAFALCLAQRGLRNVLCHVPPYSAAYRVHMSRQATRIRGDSCVSGSC